MRLESLSVSTNLRQKAPLIVRLGQHHFASLHIDTAKLAHHGIDGDARRALTSVEVIGHQQVFGGGPPRGDALHCGDLRNAASHVARALLVQRTNELLPVIALQPEHAAQEFIDAGGARFRRGRSKPEQRLRRLPNTTIAMPAASSRPCQPMPRCSRAKRGIRLPIGPVEHEVRIRAS